MPEPTWLARVIACYSNQTGELLDEFALPPVELEDLQISTGLAAECQREITARAEHPL